MVFGLCCRQPLGGLWLRLCCWLGRGWCCAGACPPPPWCCVSVFGLGSWCCSQLDARLVLLVRRCLRRRTASVVGCLLPVVFAWPGLVLCWCVQPPPVGACRACVWPPNLWGVLCQRVRVSVRGVVAGWMLGLFCWCAVVSAAVRPAWSGVGCLWCFPGREGRAGLPSACGAPPRFVVL